MAEEAFALSPISARGSLPSEADYDAIREAFMETARGRWFLNEFAKRNRTADTAEVLDAVGRIESTLAATKDSAVSLMASLSSIRAAVRAAKVSAAEAMPRPGAMDTDSRLSAARDGVRTVAEISRTMRQCGADARMCDLIDRQVNSITLGQQVDNLADSRKAVLGAFDVLIQRIEQLAAGGHPSIIAPAPNAPAPQATATPAEKPETSVTPLFRAPPAAIERPAAASVATPAVTAAPAPVVAPMPAAPSQPVAAVQPAAQLSPSVSVEAEKPDAVKALADAPAIPSAAVEPLRAATPAVAEQVVAAPPASPAAAVITTEPAAERPQPGATEDLATAEDVATAEDLAMLDLVAQEMGAPQDDDADSGASPYALPDVPPSPYAHAPLTAMPASAMAAAASAPVVSAPTLAPMPDAAEARAPMPEPSEPDTTSLGAALIANGVIPNPAGPKTDPLAAIRRMTQTEKIALFS